MSQDMDVFSCYPPFGGCVQWPYGGRVKHPPKSHEKSVAGCDQSLWCGCLLREHEQPWRRIAILLDSRIWYMDMIYIYTYIFIYIHIYILLYYIYIILHYTLYIYILYVCVSHINSLRNVFWLCPTMSLIPFVYVNPITHEDIRPF